MEQLRASPFARAFPTLMRVVKEGDAPPYDVRLACDVCHADITDKARIVLADGRVICAGCTQMPPEHKVAPQICGRGG